MHERTKSVHVSHAPSLLARVILFWRLARLSWHAHGHAPLSCLSDLGVFGKQMVDGEGGVGGDLALVGTFFVVVLVGTFASQVRPVDLCLLSASGGGC